MLPSVNVVLYCLCSNYDTKLHKKKWYAPSSSLYDLYEHTFLLDNLRVAVVDSPLPKHRKQGKQYLCLFS